jgi:pimeloyl-ACP methyl ester carboxylesterase
VVQPGGDSRDRLQPARRPELVVIDDCGHLPNMEAEQEFNAALLAFLSRHVP